MNARELFIDQGWSIVQADAPAMVETVRGRFIDEMRVRGLTCEDMKDLRAKLCDLPDQELNRLKATPLEGISQLMVEAFKGYVQELCGKHIFLQRRPHLNINVPFRNNSVTMPHTEMLSGHSPFTVVLWIPLHDIEDESGLFCVAQDKSIEFMENQKDFRVPFDEELLRRPSTRLKFGQGIAFNSLVLHGASPHRSTSARVSLDVRFQSCTKPLFEKNIDYFRTFTLDN